MIATRKSAADLFQLPDEGAGYELVDGVFQESIVSTQSQAIGGNAYGEFRDYAQKNRNAWPFPPETGFLLLIDGEEFVRKPDAALTLGPRMTSEDFFKDGFCPVVPDLVVEVISPNDVMSKLTAKRLNWIAAGVKVVWVIDPTDQSVYVYGPNGLESYVRAKGTLTCESIFPGLAVSVDELFRLPVA